MDEGGARPGDDDAEVTLTADTDTFRSILDGDLNPTAAFMSGRLKIDGDMGAAMPTRQRARLDRSRRRCATTSPRDRRGEVPSGCERATA